MTNLLIQFIQEFKCPISFFLVVLVSGPLWFSFGEFLHVCRFP